MINLFPRLPLGGKLLAKQGDEGQPNNIQAFSLQKPLYNQPAIPASPWGEAVGFRRLKRSLHAFPFPYVKPSPCLHKILLSLFPSLPLGGRLLAKQGGEGQPNNIQAFFSSKSRFILNPRSCFPRRGKCLRKQTIEVDSNFFIFPRLPLGGKLLAKQGDEGQPNNIQAFFSSKSRLILNPHSRLPLRGSCRLLPTEEVFAILPLACIKLSTASCLPLSSTLSPSKAFPPLLFHRCYIPAFVAPALPVLFNPRFSSYPLFSKTFLLAILSLRIVVFAGSTIIIS